MIRAFALLGFLFATAAHSAETHDGPLNVTVPESFTLFEESQLEQRRAYIEAKQQIAQARSDLAEVRQSACLALVQLDLAIDRGVYLGEASRATSRGGDNERNCFE